MKFTKTVFINSVSPLSAQMKGFQIGQWLQCYETGIRGQYLGETFAGPIVHWIKPMQKFGKQFARGNKPLRQYAVINRVKL